MCLIYKIWNIAQMYVAHKCSKWSTFGEYRIIEVRAFFEGLTYT